jgi:D-alanyl-D-alanine carboxypeptidase/D-alanyl-D-alanine-endopeptidase (penicillin-binding protein 4)
MTTSPPCSTKERRRFQSALALLLGATMCVAALASDAFAGTALTQRLDQALRGKAVSVHVAENGGTLYSRGARKRRIPASTEKLLLSMALLERFPEETTLPTIASGHMSDGGVVDGDLFVLGSGDPALTEGGPWGRMLPFRPTRVSTLARRIAKAGVKRINGHVVGSTGYFEHDWRARGWRPYFPGGEVGLPSALTFEGNIAHRRFVDDPERHFAKSLTRALERLGVHVDKGPAAWRAPAGANHLEIARVSSRPLRRLLSYMNHRSSNFFAEVLGKRLGVALSGPRGTIRKGARAIERYAARHGASVKAFDSSGLSFANRISARGLVRLLASTTSKSWGRAFRRTLPEGGTGTLENRLRGVHVRAKTGTLGNVSALAGWVRLRKSGTFAEFAILSRGLAKSRAVSLEDRIVRTVHKHARSWPFGSDVSGYSPPFPLWGILTAI